MYTTLNQEAALHALDKFEDKWDEKYQYAIDSWRNNRTELTVFYAL
ncbi:hypothetical protein EMN46_09655 [Ancylomarina sp. 16SWW S1-10-2]|nr:hypothetical protein [Ancylomarina sp. 16SWW S1-10-2]